MEVLENNENIKKTWKIWKIHIGPSLWIDLLQNRTLVRPYFVSPLLVMEFNVHPGVCGVLV